MPRPNAPSVIRTDGLTADDRAAIGRFLLHEPVTPAEARALRQALSDALAVVGRHVDELPHPPPGGMTLFGDPERRDGGAHWTGDGSALVRMDVFPHDGIQPHRAWAAPPVEDVLRVRAVSLADVTKDDGGRSLRLSRRWGPLVRSVDQVRWWIEETGLGVTAVLMLYRRGELVAALAPLRPDSGPEDGPTVAELLAEAQPVVVVRTGSELAASLAAGGDA